MNREKLKAVAHRTRNDATFRQQLLADPMGVCNAEGCVIPKDCDIKIVEHRASDVAIILDQKTGVAELDRIVNEANSNPTFKRQLLDTPKATVEKFIGSPLPEACTVRVFEPCKKTLRLLIAPLNEELTEAELEAVAGGGFFKNVANLFCRDSTYTRTVIEKNSTASTSTAVDPSIGGFQTDGWITA